MGPTPDRVVDVSQQCPLEEMITGQHGIGLCMFMFSKDNITMVIYIYIMFSNDLQMLMLSNDFMVRYGCGQTVNQPIL